MLDPNEAINRLRKHFSEVSSEQFIKNVEKYCPEIMTDESKKIATKTKNDSTPVKQRCPP